MMPGSELIFGGWEVYWHLLCSQYFPRPITGKCQTFSQLFHRLPMCVAQFEGVEHFLADVVVRLDNSDLSCVYYY